MIECKLLFHSILKQPPFFQINYQIIYAEFTRKSIYISSNKVASLLKFDQQRTKYSQKYDI